MFRYRQICELIGVSLGDIESASGHVDHRARPDAVWLNRAFRLTLRGFLWPGPVTSCASIVLITIYRAN